MAALLMLMGCSGTRGLLYTNVTRPFSADYNHSVVSKRCCVLTSHEIKEPFSGRGITVRWTKDQISATARKAGIETISYIDEQTISFVFGMYRRSRLFIYGQQQISRKSVQDRSDP